MAGSEADALEVLPTVVRGHDEVATQRVCRDCIDARGLGGLLHDVVHTESGEPFADTGAVLTEEQRSATTFPEVRAEEVGGIGVQLDDARSCRSYCERDARWFAFHVAGVCGDGLADFQAVEQQKPDQNGRPRVHLISGREERGCLVVTEGSGGARRGERGAFNTRRGKTRSEFMCERAKGRDCGEASRHRGRPGSLCLSCGAIATQVGLGERERVHSFGPGPFAEVLKIRTVRRTRMRRLVALEPRRDCRRQGVRFGAFVSYHVSMMPIRVLTVNIMNGEIMWSFMWCTPGDRRSLLRR